MKNSKIVFNLLLNVYRCSEGYLKIDYYIKNISNETEIKTIRHENVFYVLHLNYEIYEKNTIYSRVCSIQF